ncbi:MAG: ankyrin repeat domain-containing protein [Gemmatimonadaceae bacterium]|nr:ankyrin repeat domain-containing protein [Gemmatimonadaceae bacterium]
MSDTNDSPAGGPDFTLDNLRRQAKLLLKQARSGDPVLIARLRALLPRLASLDDATVQADIKLADIHHAVARKNGKSSWRELTAFMKRVDPIHVHGARFLLALRDHDTAHAKAMLDAHPELARYSIHCAAAVGNPSLVAAFLAKDVRLATSGFQPDGPEPLIYACHMGLQSLLGVTEIDRVRTVQLLLDAGASANAYIRVGDHGEAHIPALYFACVSDNVAVARLLLERGANPNDGESVYHAAEMNHRECLELLAAHGAELSAAHSQWGNTPLYFLAGYKESDHRCGTATLGMQWLLAHGANPNVLSHVNAGTDDPRGVAEAPLHRVASFGREVAVARMLVEHGAVVDLPRGDGKSAYALAMRTGNMGVATYLAECGANTAALTPVDRFLAACIGADEHAARAILATHPALMSELTAEDRQTLALAVERDREASVRLMFALGWVPSDEGEWGGTPLHWAAWHGRVNMVRVLLECGAPVNVRDRTYGSSPIAWASHGSTNARPGNDADYVAVTEMLLDAGATRAESYNKWGESPENMASTAVAQLLRARGFAG